MDTVSKKQRSEIMSLVRSKETKMEIAFRKMLWQKGFRYRKNSVNYFGKPDIILKKYRTVIFLDSCFWHGCKKHCRMPSTNKKYWIDKIDGNQKRDKKVNKYYKKIGWKIIRIWEHDLKSIEYHFLLKTFYEKINNT
ncbi:MAG: DNA mismatch endonuclease, patch repair protein [Candidatus Berkelbacteria bacterium Licking1014_85]|uniref:Very short patch repair endonuclease n=1 Tax=Candidatus Berkelbacteria bacterium Licking1014_85 TaxID=2017148 RepID=A0A554LHN2_9BACT|nr:MAG: DNA mismatch endonuclease, patch repair protein [Candidatus Berkelbacteria bacterium Licking1014_85]